nr:classical arabinogalactan protein 4-like [Lolium perenne]
MPLSSSSATQLPACPLLAPRCRPPPATAEDEETSWRPSLPPSSLSPILSHARPSLWLFCARGPNPSPPQSSSSPPFYAAPRPTNAATSSAQTPSSSSAHACKPGSPESGESGSAYAAGHRLSPATPASPRLAVDTRSSAVSF